MPFCLVPGNHEALKNGHSKAQNRGNVEGHTCLFLDMPPPNKSPQELVHEKLWVEKP
jgi:hypothetical protein